MPEPTITRAAADVARRLADALRERVSPPATTAAADAVAADLLAADASPEAEAMARWSRFTSTPGMSAFERNLLGLAALPHEHEGAAAVLAHLHPRREPTAWVGLAAEILLTGSGERVHLRRALIAGSLARLGVVVDEPHPFSHRSLVLPSAVWQTLHGFDAWPAGVISPRFQPFPAAPASNSAPAEATARRLLTQTDAAIPVTVLVTGDDLEEATLRADQLVRASGRAPRHLTRDAVVPPGHDLAALGLLCELRAEVPILRVDGDPLDPRWTATVTGPLVVVAPAGNPFDTAFDTATRVLIRIDVAPLGLPERVAVWNALLPDAPQIARRLAAVHRVSSQAARRAVSDTAVIAAATDLPVATDERLLAAQLRARAVSGLPASARLVHPQAQWTDLVLPEHQRNKLLTAADRIRSQSTVLHDWELARTRLGHPGVRLLFTGLPGTGKTLAAELMAVHLGVDLLVVDLAALVSRWLGETEKNLATVFDAAERSQAVLFFDEADAMFAKRTDIGDSRDRWANLETAYLLGRIERFDGVAILATNLRSNIDEAFVRRLEFIVEFDEPEPAERRRLWEGHLPTTIPRHPDVELDELAQLYPMTGAVIRNAALAAAFLAAADGGRVGQQHLVTAIRREYDKAGRSFPGVPLSLRSASHA